MALPAVLAFHNQQMAQERERVALRIANGLKSDSSNIIGVRRQHPSFKGLPDNSTGSRNMPFFASKDESQCPLEDKIRMRGGVLNTKAGKEYGYEILKRRARDDMNIRATAEGLPPTPAPLMELDPVESRSLELDEILAEVDDAADAGDFSGLSAFGGDLKNIPRLVIALSPSLSEGKIGALIEFLGNLHSKLIRFYQPDGRNMPTIIGEITAAVDREGFLGEARDREIERRVDEIQRGGPRSRQAPIQRIANLVVSIYNYLKVLLNAKNQGLGDAEIRQLIGAAAKEFFKFNRKEVKASFGRLSTPQQEINIAGPSEVAAADAPAFEAPAAPQTITRSGTIFSRLNEDRVPVAIFKRANSQEVEVVDLLTPENDAAIMWNQRFAPEFASLSNINKQRVSVAMREAYKAGANAREILDAAVERMVPMLGAAGEE